MSDRHFSILMICISIALISLTPIQPLHAADLSIPDGNIEFNELSGDFVEAFDIPEIVAQRLATKTDGSAITFDQFPVEPGNRARVELKRIDLYGSAQE